MSRPVVAHFVPLYLPRTETFVYEAITHHRRYEPIVLAQHRVETARLFPFRELYVHEDLRRRWSLHAWYERAQFYLRGRAFGRFESVLVRRRASVLHVHFGHVGADAIGLATKAGIPQVTSFYGWDDTVPLENAKWQPRFERLFREGAAFLLEGTHIAKRLVERGCPPAKARIHRVGVDLAKIPFRPPAPPLPGEPVRLLFCGRLVEKKGLRFAVEAVARAAAAGLALELRVVGDGPLRAEVERRIDELGARPFVRMLGPKTHAEYLEELAESHLVIQPSVTAADGETEGGAPTVVIEAQAAGKPVLATEHADIPEVVLPERSAILVPEKDAAALATALTALARDPARWRAMAEAGRRHVEAEHDLERQMSRLESLYDELVGARSSRR